MFKTLALNIYSAVNIHQYCNEWHRTVHNDCWWLVWCSFHLTPWFHAGSILHYNFRNKTLLKWRCFCLGNTASLCCLGQDNSLPFTIGNNNKWFYASEWSITLGCSYGFCFACPVSVCENWLNRVVAIVRCLGDIYRTPAPNPSAYQTNENISAWRSANCCK